MNGLYDSRWREERKEEIRFGQNTATTTVDEANTEDRGTNGRNESEIQRRAAGGEAARSARTCESDANR